MAGDGIDFAELAGNQTSPWINDPPRAEIRKIGRWTYSVRILRISSCGPFPGGPWHVLGAKRAERFARKQLAAYVLDEARRRQPPKIVSVGDL